MKVIARCVGIVTSVLVLLLMPLAPTHAQSRELVCDRTSCTPDSLEVLFSPSLIWSPGEKKTETITVRNSDAQTPLRVAVHFDHHPDPSATCQMDRHISIRLTSTGGTVEKSLRSWSQSVSQAGVVLPGQSLRVAVEAHMDPATPDSCQGASTQMDIRLRIDEVPKAQQVQRATRPQQEGSVLGIAAGPVSCTTCIWWQLYVLQGGLYLVYAYILRRPTMRSILALGPVAAGIPLAAQLLYLVLNSGCLSSWYGVVYVWSSNPFCALMLVWSIALYLIFLTVWGLLLYTPRQ